MVVWTDEIVERLRVLWETGLSAALMATAVNVAFGTEFSRSAILGKAFRMQLGLHRAPTNRSHQGPRSLAPTQSPKPPTVTKKRQLRNLPVQSQEPVLSAGESSCAVSFAELDWQHCRWPLTDGRYCGADKRWRMKRGKLVQCAYCERHAALAYVAPRPRLDRIAASPRFAA